MNKSGSTGQQDVQGTIITLDLGFARVLECTFFS